MLISNNSLGEILKEKGIITEKQLNEALKLQREMSIRLDEAFTRLDIADPDEIIKGLAEQFGLDVVDPLSTSIMDEVIKIVTKSVAKKYQIIPIKKQNGVLTVAMSNPFDISTMDDLRLLFNTNVQCVLTTSKNIEEAIKKYYEQEQDGQVQEKDISFGDYFGKLDDTDIEVVKTSEQTEEVEGAGDEGPIVKLVSYLIEEAVKSRASDIHIEPLSKKIRIRYRIDGVCKEVNTIKKEINEALISRIKILSKMDITEKRKPQDGRIGLKLGERPIDIRVNTIPTSCGESVVMRILEKSTSLMRLKSMGFSERDYENLQNALKKPNGIVLITGPTGSGKSTTLYAALNEVNSITKKIITVEDPIENTMPGVNQCEVNEKIGLTFPSVLRTMLRQDPNIIVIGEIRDVETAEIAVSAALTGHLVLSTLHTNDAPSAITRLADMGVHQFLISSSLLAVLAQRLVRVICPECKVPHEVEDEELSELGLNSSDVEDIEFYHGIGCERCNKTGYYGRKGVYEFMTTGMELRDAIYNKAGRNDLRKIARSYGMTTLMEDGLRLAKNQITTLSEVSRVAVK